MIAVAHQEALFTFVSYALGGALGRHAILRAALHRTERLLARKGRRAEAGAVSASRRAALGTMRPCASLSVSPSSSSASRRSFTGWPA